MLSVHPVEIDPNSEEKFYVYVYRDPRDGVPIYVGKGTENNKYGRCARARFHWEKCRASKGSRGSRALQAILRDLDGSGLVPIIEIVGRFAEESAAFKGEEELIQRHGRRDLGLGSLCNLSDGGEGPVGFRHTEAALQKIGHAARLMHSDKELSARRAANIAAALNRPATKTARSAIMKEVHSRPGDKERRTAAQRATFSTPEHKALRAKTTREVHAKPETKAVHSASLRKRWSKPGAKEAQSAAMRALYEDPDHKKMQAESVRAWFASPEYAAKKRARLLSRSVG
jgi:hypothetical protein